MIDVAELHACEVAEGGPISSRVRAELKYDGHRQLLKCEDDTVFDAEKVANGGFAGTLYILNRTNLPPSERIVTYRIFDILFLEGKDVRQLPLNERLKLLTNAHKLEFGQDHPTFQLAELVMNTDTIHGLLEARDKAVKMRYEGVVAKPLAGAYGAGWVKAKSEVSLDLVILGIKETKSWLESGLPESFIVGEYDPEAGEFREVGTVSAGLAKADKLQIAKDLADKMIETRGGIVWVQPVIVVEVKCLARLPSALREPRIIQRRSDKKAEECTNQ